MKSALTTAINKTQELTSQPIVTPEEDWLDKMSEKANKWKITDNCVSDDANCLLRVDDTNIISRKSLTVVTGGSGSRKSTFIAALMACVLSQDSVFDGVTSNQPSVGKILWFDTEQTQAEANRLRNIVRTLSNIPAEQFDNRFVMFGLVEGSVEERNEFIQYAIEAHYPAVVIIDGLRDLCESINDEREAKAIVDWFIRTSNTYNFAAISAIHVNPSQRDEFIKAQGNLGSYLEQKAKTVAFVTKDKEDTRFGSYIKFVKTRGMQPAMRKLRQDRAGITLISVEDIPQETTINMHNEFVKIFDGRAMMSSSELVEKFMEHFGYGRSSAMTKIGEAVGKFLFKSKTGKRVFYSLTKIDDSYLDLDEECQEEDV